MLQVAEAMRRAAPRVARDGEVSAGTVQLDRAAADRDAPAVRQCAVPLDVQPVAAATPRLTSSCRPR